jgi:transcription termination factor Rho
VKIDSINGLPIRQAADRVEFGKLTPSPPSGACASRPSPGKLTTRSSTSMSPIQRGQRGLIGIAPKVGKTLVLQAIANAIAKNNPGYLMKSFWWNQEEEVTDMQRTVRVRSSPSTVPQKTTPRSPEGLISRAGQTSCELAHDVVVLLDSIDHPPRPCVQPRRHSGIRSHSVWRVDSAGYPPERFFCRSQYRGTADRSRFSRPRL